MPMSSTNKANVISQADNDKQQHKNFSMLKDVMRKTIRKFEKKEKHIAWADDFEDVSSKTNFFFNLFSYPRIMKILTQTLPLIKRTRAATKKKRQKVLTLTS